MIRVCVPTGSSHGWGVCGVHLLEELQKITTIAMETDARYPALVAVTGSSFLPLKYIPSGPRNVGLAFIEKPTEAAKYLLTYNNYFTGLICGSTWMAEKMREISIANVHVALQGVGFDVFKPTDDRVALDAPFTVFSGGKFEYRKSQDIVIAAMKIFMEKHQDVRLIAAWGNIWPQTMTDMGRSKWIKYANVSSNWKTQVMTTLNMNGIPLDRVTLPEMTTNQEQVDLYRQAHLGLFPNRGEAGNNMVMCEAIASGLLCFGSMGTGHLDLGNCYGHLTDGVTTEPDGWWDIESLDEILSILELFYARRDFIAQTRDRNAAAIRELISWPKFAAKILEVLTQ